MMVGELINLLEPFRGRGDEVIIMEESGIFYRIVNAFWSDGNKCVIVRVEEGDRDPAPAPLVADSALMTELILRGTPVPKKKKEESRCSYCGDPALYWNNTRCGPSGCYNCPA